MKYVKGREYKITETYPSGATVIYQGKATADVDSRLSNYVNLEAGNSSHVTAYSQSGTAAQVVVEEIAGPLPTAWGSVIRYYYAGRDKPEQFQVQMRVPPEDMRNGAMGHWRTHDSSLVAHPIDGAWDLIFDADHPED